MGIASVKSKESPYIQATIECRFTLKCIGDTIITYSQTSWLLVKSEQKQRRIIIKKGNVKYKSHMSMFSIRFCILLFFQSVFDSSYRNSQKLINKSINYEQTSFPLKRKNNFFFAKNICIPMICVSMIWIFILRLTVAVKLVPLQPYDRKYFSVKTANVYIFSNVNRK